MGIRFKLLVRELDAVRTRDVLDAPPVRPGSQYGAEPEPSWAAIRRDICVLYNHVTDRSLTPARRLPRAPSRPSPRCLRVCPHPSREDVESGCASSPPSP